MVQIGSTFVFRDPLLSRQYMPNRLRSYRMGAVYMDYNLEGDFAMDSYISGLDEDIFLQVGELFVNPATKEFWYKNHLYIFFAHLTDVMRLHGYGAVQVYLDDVLIFTESNRIDWLRNEIIVEDFSEEDSRKKEVVSIEGIKVQWHDPLGNSYTDTIHFDKEKGGFLFKWKEPRTNERFAIPDLTQAKLTLFYSIRQINAQLVFSSIKPNFLHSKLGNSSSPKFEKSMKSITKKTSNISGIAAKEANLIEMNPVELGMPDKHILGLDKQVQFLAGATRLPQRFFLSYRENSGMSDVGEKEDDLRVNKRKNEIWLKMRPIVQELMLFAFGQDPSMKDEMPFEENLDEIQEGKDEDNSNGKKEENERPSNPKTDGKA